MQEPGAWLSWAADIASIVSLGVSFYVAWQVRGIKRRFVKRFAVANFVRQLLAHKRNLTGFIKAASYDKVELLDELARCEVNLRWAAQHLDRVSARDARSALYLFDEQPPDIEALCVIVIGLLQGLENAATERKAEAHVE